MRRALEESPAQGRRTEKRPDSAEVNRAARKHEVPLRTMCKRMECSKETGWRFMTVSCRQAVNGRFRPDAEPVFAKQGLGGALEPFQNENTLPTLRRRPPQHGVDFGKNVILPQMWSN